MVCSRGMHTVMIFFVEAVMHHQVESGESGEEMVTIAALPTVASAAHLTTTAAVNLPGRSSPSNPLPGIYGLQ